jgi:hypothetical protein
METAFAAGFRSERFGDFPDFARQLRGPLGAVLVHNCQP